jgi:hypothetical protein
MILPGGCMTQHLTKKAFADALKAQEYSPFLIERIVETVKPQTIDRGIGWDLFKLFVSLANTDVRQLRAGDLLNLQEDLMKFYSLGSLSTKIPPPNVDELDSFQKTLSRHLRELMNEGKTTLGPFQSTILAMRQTIKLPNSDERTIFRSMNFPTGEDKFLIHEFAKLLEKYGSLLSKCPHCGRIFLQLRKNAVYCDRKCQRVAAMRNIRAKQKEAVAEDSKKGKEGRRNKHGKTRR